MLRKIGEGAVIVDVSIDQGGSFETSRPTSHSDPIFVDESILHYCVPNMPGVVARTSTHAFVNAAMPYILEMANLGTPEAILLNPALEKAVNTRNGELVHLRLLSQGVRDGLE